MQFVDAEAQERFEKCLDKIREHFGYPQPPGRKSPKDRKK